MNCKTFQVHISCTISSILDKPKNKNLKTLLFSKNIKPSRSESERVHNKQKYKEYKQLLDHVTNKIEKWHDSMSLKKRGKFLKDEEFFKIEPSPSKFHSR